jgi:hypothetical protein
LAISNWKSQVVGKRKNITMKRYVLMLLGGLLIMSSCATNYSLSKSVWYNTSPVEKDGIQGTIVTSLYFVAADTVNIYSSVIVGSNLEVTPFKIAEGTYSVSGNPQKEAQLSITAVDINQNEINYQGAYYKNTAMILVSPGSNPKLFGKLPKTKLP